MFFKYRFELKEYGEEFKDSYVTLYLFNKKQGLEYKQGVLKIADKKDIPSVDLESEIIDFMYARVKDSFVEGKIFDGKETRDMVKGDIDEFPRTIVRSIVEVLNGSIEKKD